MNFFSVLSLALRVIHDPSSQLVVYLSIPPYDIVTSCLLNVLFECITGISTKRKKNHANEVEAPSA